MGLDDIQKRIITLIEKCKPEDAPDLDEEIEFLAADVGWNKVLDATYKLLCLREYERYWYSAACIIAWATQDRIEIPHPNIEIVARLYWCLEKSPNLGLSIDLADNLVWSITIALMDISYMSGWNPLEEKQITDLIAEFG